MKFKNISFLIILIASFAPSHTSTANNSEQKMKLFIYKNCPYCHKVINFIKQIGHMADVQLVDASSKSNQAQLQTISGDSQCPYLVDEENNISMAESADIIDYLKKRFNKM